MYEMLVNVKDDLSVINFFNDMSIPYFIKNALIHFRQF